MQSNLIDKYLLSLNIHRELNSLSHVNKLIQKHLEEFLFTSIPVLLKEELSLELSGLYEKIVIQKRGGYCFEHNKLMYEVLLHCGFEVDALFGRVLNNQNIKVPKTHRFTLLKFEGEKYIVDVGFGFSSPSIAVKFGLAETISSLGVEYIIKEYDDKTFALGIIKDNDFYTLYKFDLNVYYEPDFEMGHFYSHKHSKANFVNNLVLSRIKADEILSLRNRSFQKIYKTHTKEIIITTLEQLKDILEDEFSYPIEYKELENIYILLT